MSKLALSLVCATAFQFVYCLPSTTLTATTSAILLKDRDDITGEAFKLQEKNAISSARQKLSAMIKENNKKHLNFLLQGSNKIAKDLIEDPRIKQADNEALQKDRAMLEQYVKDSDTALIPHSETCIKRVLKEFYTFTNSHTLKKQNRKEENDIVLDALKSHGFEEFEMEENKLLNEIGMLYADEFEKYLSSLSPAEREKEKDLVYVFETNLENPGIMDRSNYGFRYMMHFSGK